MGFQSLYSRTPPRVPSRGAHFLGFAAICWLLDSTSNALAAGVTPQAETATAPATATAAIAPPQATQLSAVSPLTPDRPGFTNGSDVVLVGKTQLEVGIATTRAFAVYGGGDTTDYPEALIRRGLTPVLELGIALPDYFQPNGGQSGWSDASVGVKYKCYKSKDGNTKAMVIPAVTLTTGTNGYSSGQMDPSITAGIQTQSGSRWSLAANLSAADPTVGGRRIAQESISASASYALTPKLGTYGDAFDAFPSEGSSTPIADGGFTYLVGSALQLDMEAGCGLSNHSPARFFGAGVSTRF